MDDSLYWYKAFVFDVYDGDTITCNVDLGLNSWLKYQKMRLYGIDAPELRGDEREKGLVVRDWLRDKILGKEILIRTYKDKRGSFGRWLVEVVLYEDFVSVFDYCSINYVMLSFDLATPYEK